MLRSIRKNKGKRNVRIALVVMTAVLAFGLVFSFSLWSAPSAPQQSSDQQSNGGEASSEDFESMEERVEELREDLKEDPEDVETMRNLGNALHDLGVARLQNGEESGEESLKEALEIYEQVLEQTSEEDLKLELLAGNAAFYTGNIDKAEKYYQNALEIDPESIDAKMNYGQFLLYGKGDTEAAKKQLNEALNLASSDAAKETIKQMIQTAEQIEQQNEGLQDEEVEVQEGETGDEAQEGEAENEENGGQEN